MDPDRISNLPCNVLDDIIKYLPLCEAVRTSVLSTEWRYKWVTIPYLVFDSKFVDSLQPRYIPDIIFYHLLLSHKGSLLKFSLSTGVKSRFSVDHWFNFLSSHRNIEVLILHFPSFRTHYRIPQDLFGFNRLKHLSLENVFIKPPCTFRGFNRLVQLYLNNVCFAPEALQRFMSKCSKLEFLGITNCDNIKLQLLAPQNLYETPLNLFDISSPEPLRPKLPRACQGFSRLVKLDLTNVHFNSVQLQSLISKCPMLEFLSIIQHFDFTFYSCVIDAPNLKVLYLVGLFNSIFLNTPSLEEFSLEYGDCRHLQSERYFSGYKRCDYFASVELPKSNEGENNLIKTFGHLPSLRKLKGCVFFLQFMAIGGLPQELPNKLNQLTHLTLQYINFGILDNVMCILCLIRSSPNLESLDILSGSYYKCLWLRNMTASMKYRQKRKVVAFLNASAQKECRLPLSHLKTVTIEGLLGLQPEMEFVKFLLSKLGRTGVSKFEVSFRDGAGYKDRDEMMSFLHALSGRIPLTLR